jgi:exodeoxyribonuclease III
MRILTWNCQMGLHQKAQMLTVLDPDIAVIPECAESASIGLAQQYKGTWFGSNKHKGLGVFVREPGRFRLLAQPKQKWIVALDIEGLVCPIRLIAVWACTGTKRQENYIGQVYEAFVENPHWFTWYTIVAGDFNSNSIWDSEHPVGSHSEVVRLLRDHGLVSAYHEFYGEQQGAETRPTQYFQRNLCKPYHIDYVFIPQPWTKSLIGVSVGDFDTWAALSDHRPIVVNVDL